MNYWLDLFTGTTWDEFRAAGSTISGFRLRTRATTTRVQRGDVFLCYMIGVKRWVGALEVIAPTDDQRPIWSGADSIQFQVHPIISLEPEYGIPMDDLEGQVEFFSGPADRGKYKGFVRGSPNLFKRQEDGEHILRLLKDAEQNPVARPVDQKQLARKPYFTVTRRTGRKTAPTVVSIPEPDALEQTTQESAATMRHTEIQYLLLRLGAEMGLDLWVAANDRGRVWTGQALGSLPRIVDSLPTQFDDVTNRIIKLIDVLWLKGNAIVAAFEVESTTSVYSGLLRMNDLLALQPSLDVNLYLVAPDELRDKVENEMLRPTFKLRDKPLTEVCGFISFSRLVEKVEGIRRLGLQSSLKPDFLQATAEFFGDEEVLP